jgi:SsrA-binding protein
LVEKDNYKVISDNRKARYEYELLDTFEAGIVLYGSEVKSLRLNGGNIADAHAGEMAGKLCLFNSNIPEYKAAKHFNHEPRRVRDLLVRKKELKKLLGKVKTKGLTIIPLKLYFNRRGIAKVEIALAQGKKQYEKRDAIKERDWQRSKEKIFKDKW